MKRTFTIIAVIYATAGQGADVNIAPEQAYAAGQLANIYGFCQVPLTSAALDLMGLASDAYGQRESDFKDGFQSISEIDGYTETEEAGLGSALSNGLRRGFCENALAPLFPQWMTVD